MSDVTRYRFEELCPTGETMVMGSDYDTALSQLAALREELARVKAQSAQRLGGLADCGIKREAAEQRLADAERRNADLVELLQGWLDLFPYRGTFQDGPLAKMKGHTRAALNKPEEAKS